MPATNPDAMSAAEFCTRTEALGLDDRGPAARYFDVSERTIVRWQAGHVAVPRHATDELVRLEVRTDALVTALLESLRRAAAPTVTAYLSDGALHIARPETHDLPAKWWRSVVARVRHDLPELDIVQGD